jgi:phosphatidylglycerophosphatase A
MSKSDTDRPPEAGGRVPLFVRFIATGAFTGHIPWGSGTFGTALGLGLALIPGTDHPTVLGVMILAGFFAGVYSAACVADHVGHQLSLTAKFTKSRFQVVGGHRTPDPSIVVIDEIVGMWVALFLLPRTPLALVLAFVAFRAMDVLKPQPARYFERIPHGWGIMLDDIAAGIYANLLTRIILFALTSADLL